MRELKFRAWDKDNEEWLHDFMITRDGQVLTLDEDANLMTNDVDAIVMEFIGLHDKNGTKVFEEDILKLTFLHYELNLSLEEDVEAELCTELIDIGIIEEGLETVGLNEFNGSEYTARELLDLEFEVVGNNFENPELLDKEMTK